MMDSLPTFEHDRASLRPKAIIILVGFGLFFVACGVFSLWQAFLPGELLAVRLLQACLAVAALFLPVFFAIASLRLKWKTGRWTISPEERRARLAHRTKHPSRIIQVASSAFGRNIADVMLIILATINIALEIRKTMHVSQVMIIAVWVLIAALSLWAILRRWMTRAS